GRVVHGADHLRVEAFRRVELTVSKVKDASWVDSTTLAAIGTTTGRAVEPLLINVNRTVTPLSTDVLVNLKSVVGAPGLPLMADTPQGEIWESSGSGWRYLLKGSDPAYPG
ncbi:MAG: LpqB family beta-propeller domain-containing protein, partial [Actinomycetes bacterium]